MLMYIYKASLCCLQAPIPQNGGNAVLAGSNIWVFNPKSKPAVVPLAYDWTIYNRFDLITSCGKGLIIFV